MRFFTIHERPARSGGDLEVLAPDIVAVASGFRWWAALLPPLWLLRHRLWLGLAGYLLFSAALGLLLDLGGIADPAATAIGLAVSFLIGATAADYRRWTLRRRGWRLVEVLRADSTAEAEERYIRERGILPSAGTTVATAVLPPMLPRGNTEAFPRLL